MKFTIELSPEHFQEALDWLADAVDEFESYDDAGQRLLVALREAEQGTGSARPTRRKFAGGAF